MSIYVYSATSKTIPILIDDEVHQATYYKYTHNQSLEDDFNWYGASSKGLFGKIKFWANRALSKAKTNNIKYVIVGDDEFPNDDKSVFRVQDVNDLTPFIWDHDPNEFHERLGSFKKSKLGRKIIYVLNLEGDI